MKIHPTGNPFPLSSFASRQATHLAVLCLLSGVCCISTFAQGTAFTCQGRLFDDGSPATGNYDLTFSLWDAASGPSQVGDTITNVGTPVSNGLFTVTLDFGAGVFTGSARWLEISVKSNGVAGPHTVLTPRQALTPSPYAVFAGGAQTATAVAAGGVNGPALAPGAVGSLAIADSSINTNDLGPGVLNSTFWLLGGNSGAGNFLGSRDNQPLELRANNLPALRLRPHAGDAPSLIGGSSSNAIAPFAPGAVIAGGGDAASPNIIAPPGLYAAIGGGKSNLASGNFSVVAGGSANQALDDYTTVSGGSQNIARFFYDTVGGGAANEAAGLGATVGGGWINRASAQGAFIGGGELNEATGHGAVIGGGSSNDAGEFAAVAGGWLNRATGTNSAVGGGKDNQASGNYSFVGGGTNNVAGSQNSVIGGGTGNSISTVFSRGTTIAGGSANSIGSQALSSTIGGGSGNEIQTYSQWSVIAGGSGNVTGAGATRAVISGGQQNRVTGSYGTIPGGYANEATNLAYAAGVAAKALHEGAWVWADGGAGDLLSPDFASTRSNQFLVRASGGVGINTNNPQATLHVRGNIATDALRAPGAGINTGTFAFIHRATAGSIVGHLTTIDHLLCNGDPNAILIITHNWSADASLNKYHPQAVGVYYNGARWTIFHEDNSTAMEVGDAFNVLVIKP
ncbi:MAG: hypothetical protein KJ070_22325 [Verrucomicrobia bacterium]|nr:hypothetical protein [Verrucomicrobiota bacterium]